MRILSKRELFSQDFEKLLAFCRNYSYGVTLGEAYRTQDQQNIYIENGRSKVKRSQHQKRLAIDLYIWETRNGVDRDILDHEWKRIGAYWLSLSPKNRWGGNFGVKGMNRTRPRAYGAKTGWDRWHFERRG